MRQTKTITFVLAVFLLNSLSPLLLASSAFAQEISEELNAVQEVVEVKMNEEEEMVLEGELLSGDEVSPILEEATVKLAEVQIEGKMEGEEISLEEALTALVSITTTQEDVEEALIQEELTVPQEAEITVDEVFLGEQVESAESVVENAVRETPADELMQVRAIGPNGERIEIPLENLRFRSGSIVMSIEPTREFTPGLYQLEVKLTNPLNGNVEILTQDFAWGVLAVNTSKDQYALHDEAQVDIGVLDDQGKPLCDAEVVLNVLTPSGLFIDVPVQNTGNCEVLDSMNIQPDYQAFYIFEELGEYKLTITATQKDGNSRISSSTVLVSNLPDYTVERKAATRLYPVGSSSMDIDITFNRDFIGSITDSLPASFDVIDTGGGGMSTGVDGESKLISWHIEAKAGEVHHVSYLYDAPDISPEFYTVGPLMSGDGIFEEKRRWQIANDEPIIGADRGTELLGQWKLNAVSTTTATDSSDNSNDLTLTNIDAGNWITGTPPDTNQNPYALSFNGTDEYGSVADPAGGELDFGDTNDFTITGWFKRDSFGTYDTLVAKRNGKAVIDVGYMIYINQFTNMLIFEVSDGTDRYRLESSTVFSDTGWNHFAVVWDQDSPANSEIFINGYDDNATDTGTIGNVGNLANALAFTIAGESDGGDILGGSLDDIRVYNRVLANEEISVIAQGNAPGAVSSVLSPISTVEINDATANGPVLADTDYYGRSVANIGDLNGDGVSDLVVGAYADNGGGTDRGAVYIQFMNTDGSIDSTVEINDSTANGPTLADSDFYGASVANIGDLNNDGVNDLAVGAIGDDEGGSARGAVHIHFMNTDGSIDSTVEINDSTANGPTLANNANYGLSIANLGDLNRDGVTDLAVGTYGDNVGGVFKGSINIHFMNTNGSIDSTVEINDSTANGPNLTNVDLYGVSLANIGDLNGDGVIDLAVGAMGDDEGGSSRGAVHIHFMNTDGSIDSTVEINDSTANGPTLFDNDFYGRSVVNMGDLDNDGVIDLAVGAYGDNGDGSDRGAVYLHFMNANGTVKLTEEINGSTENGASLADSDGYGTALANLGDLNGDSINDLAVGADGDDTGGSDRGAMHIHFLDLNEAIQNDGTVERVVEINDNTTAGPILSNSDFYGIYATNIGDLNGDGIDDLAVGATGDDAGGSSRGTVHISFMRKDGTPYSTVEINDNTVNGPVLANVDLYGSSIAGLGDLNGDGVIDLAVGAIWDDGAGSNRGAVHIHFMNTDGSVDSTVEINDSTANGPVLGDGVEYGIALANLGDLNGDGVVDLAVGAAEDGTGGTDRGAVYIHFLNTDGSVDSTVKIASGTSNGPILANGDLYGDSIENIGDLNGDGVIDIAVGASSDNTGGTDRGAVHISFLNTDGSVDSTVKIDDSTANGPVLSDGDNYGSSIVNMGDLNQDGVKDLAVGANLDDGAGSNRGAVHISFMNTDGSVDSTVEINGATANGAVLADDDNYGFSATSLGDINGDGVVDLLVGAHEDDIGGLNRGTVYIHYMNTDGSIDSTSEMNVLTGAGPILSTIDLYGYGVADIGDLNGDGVHDLVVGAPGRDTGGSIRGSIQLSFMNTDGSVDGTLEIASGTLNGPILADGDAYGRSVANLGDLNGDGVNDIGVGADLDDTGGTDRGAVHIHFMNTDGSIDSTVRIDDNTLNGPVLADSDFYGWSIANIGDLNGDGVNDLAVGANGDGAGGTDRGAVHIHFMNTDGSIDSTVRIDSNTTNGPVLGNSDFYGSSIANIGDLNGDGVSDIAVGATGDETGGTNRGTVHISFMNTDGSVDSTVEISSLTANGPSLANSDDFGTSVANIGDLNGDGVDELGVGARNDDAGGNNRGAMHIHFMNTDGSIDSTVEINDDTTNGPVLTDTDFFGSSIANMGDLNGDGMDDLAVGARESDIGGTSKGAVHIMFMKNLLGPNILTSKLKLWLRADTGVVGTAPITVWEDQSPSNNNATAGGDPELNANAINFNPTVSFDGTGDTFTGETLALPNGTQDYSMFVVYKDTASTNDSDVFGTGNGAGDSRLEVKATGYAFSGLSTATATKTNVNLLVSDNDASGNHLTYLNGALVATDGATNIISSGAYQISRSGNEVNGELAEIIVYNESLDGISTNAKSRIESYLALKYGITLNQTVARDYLASDETTEMWNKDMAGASTYDNDIAGIGQDDDSSLYQTKSKSVNADEIITIDDPSDLDDLEFLTWGNDDGSATETTDTGIPGSLDSRLTRIWQVQENNGDLGTVDIEINVADIETENDVEAYKLLVDSDTDFDGATAYDPASVVGNIITFENINFSSGQYFTLGMDEEEVVENEVISPLNPTIVGGGGGSLNPDGSRNNVCFGLSASECQQKGLPKNLHDAAGSNPNTETKKETKIKQCLNYVPLHKVTLSETAILRNSYSFPENGTLQFVVENTENQTEFITRLEWARMLMVSHCLPIYDYRSAPNVRVDGTKMPDYTDAPRLGHEMNRERDIIYSATYYGILGGTPQNTIEINRSVSFVEAIKMLVISGERARGATFQRADHMVSAPIPHDQWFFDALSKALAAGLLPKEPSTPEGLSHPITHEEATKMMLHLILKTELYGIEDAQQVKIEFRKLPR